ncbi:hypothetical protein T11_13353 [Trichinella zimbabwensis]|uniref:Uncharacterized protein n=1 Tax=Trichinella zimbabwensis TaxID=268475 RepID=A0A0V1G7N3_9BILA|nr:hypothetical protein T11_13353 [Trichinella zimbabwensis]
MKSIVSAVCMCKSLQCACVRCGDEIYSLCSVHV